MGMLAAAALLAAALACAGAEAAIAARAEVRCDILQAPYTRMQQVMLADEPVQCLGRRCWAVTRLGAGHGLACFFSLPERAWPPLPGTPSLSAP